MTEISDYLKIMRHAALKAGRELLALQSSVRRLESRKDFLSDADLKADGLIQKILGEHFPAIPYFSEEREGGVVPDGMRWVVDPLDGTYNYFIGDSNWAVSIALVEGDTTIVAVVYVPGAKRMFYAGYLGIPETVFVDDQLGFTYSRPLQVNRETNLADSQIWLEWGKEKLDGSVHPPVLEALRRLSGGVSMYPGIRNSAAADPMAVARGQIGGFVMLEPDPFDVAAAGLIIRQAGGTVTDLQGRPWKATSESIVATNGRIHDQLLDVLNR